jgi:UDP-N-acetylmuramyl pentapeptide phosphotransferase/UDP-N-acetylglucosamine-1-phosphate transferase
MNAVNLVNFMDGLDWMTIVELVPIAAALAAIGLFGYLSWPHIVISLVPCGAIIGFAFFNRPVAKLFLGDVGSLPIGLLLGWLLFDSGPGQTADRTLTASARRGGQKRFRKIFATRKIPKRIR